MPIARPRAAISQHTEVVQAGQASGFRGTRQHQQLPLSACNTTQQRHGFLVTSHQQHDSHTCKNHWRATHFPKALWWWHEESSSPNHQSTCHYHTDAQGEARKLDRERSPFHLQIGTKPLVLGRESSPGSLRISRPLRTKFAWNRWQGKGKAKASHFEIDQINLRGRLRPDPGLCRTRRSVTKIVLVGRLMDWESSPQICLLGYM